MYHNICFNGEIRKDISSLVGENALHYKNTPIPIYLKISPSKTESFRIKILMFFIFLLKT